MSRVPPFFRYLAYTLEIIIAYVLIGTPQLMPQIFGAKPCVLLCIAVTIALFEKETVAMIFGLVCGLLTDIGYANNFCFFAVFMMVLCFFIAFFAENIMVTNLLVALGIGFIVILLTLCVQFLFTYLFKGYDNAGIYFVKHYIPKILYTTAFIPVFYGLNRLITNCLYD